MTPAAHPTVSEVLLRAKALEIEAIEQWMARVELVDVLGELIHRLQHERGASSIFLASAGARFDLKRQESMALSRPLEQRLRQRIGEQLAPGQGATARKLSLMAWVLQGLQELEGLRQIIAQQALSAHDAVAAFSRLIAGCIELIFHVADAALHPAVSRLLVALLHLMQGKEAAGQERAVGALLFAGGLANEAQQQRVMHLIDAQERSLQVFVEFAGPALAERWSSYPLSPTVARLERMRRQLCTARAEAVLDTNLSDPWFDVCSERITELWALQQALMAALRDSCARHLDEARQALADSRGLLQQLKDNPPSQAHEVDRFFDARLDPAALQAPQTLGSPLELPGGDTAASVVALLQAQSARLAGMEAELDAARRALHQRKVIERAKGVLMARLGLSEEAAFRALQKTSMDQNRRLLEVAEATLALPDFVVARPPQDPHPSHSRQATPGAAARPAADLTPGAAPD